jgi:hypothetical protein
MGHAGSPSGNTSVVSDRAAESNSNGSGVYEMPTPTKLMNDGALADWKHGSS